MWQRTRPTRLVAWQAPQTRSAKRVTLIFRKRGGTTDENCEERAELCPPPVSRAGQVQKSRSSSRAASCTTAAMNPAYSSSDEEDISDEAYIARHMFPEQCELNGEAVPASFAVASRASRRPPVSRALRELADANTRGNTEETEEDFLPVGTSVFVPSYREIGVPNTPAARCDHPSTRNTPLLETKRLLAFSGLRPVQEHSGSADVIIIDACEANWWMDCQARSAQPALGYFQAQPPGQDNTMHDGGGLHWALH